MTVIGLRELSRRAGEIVKLVQKSGRPVVVTRHGRPAVALVEIDRDALEDLIVESVPEFTAGLKRADAELRQGKTRELADVLTELRRRHSPRSPSTRKRRTR